jgi:periplasmic glucans biosynthesis protein
MCVCLRWSAVIAVLLLSSSLLAYAADPAPSAAPAPAAQPHAPGTSTPGAAHPAAAPAPRPQQVAPRTFGFANVRQLAQQRAAHEYRPMSESLPASLANLTYDQLRDIRFRPTSALWHNQTLFEVQFFHRGSLSRQRVNISEVTEEGVTPVAYDPRFFTFGKLVQPPKLAASVGYAGFRVHYPLQSAAYKDELVVFLGASYFRVLGRNQRYGASARGLAIDTAEQSGEEFPSFTDFWLVRPGPQDRTLTIYALLDSKSVAGAYQFEIRPGAITQVEVHGQIFLRHAVSKVGVAPLTSMFFYGTDGGRRGDDYRPQVHDSDGLMSETGHGQWIWRPVANPRELRVNRFMDENPRGFGLIQRERSFTQYQDAESQFESRPSYWVQPLGNWNRGGVELVEIPSDEEIHDNIVAYWLPAQGPQVGKPFDFGYTLFAYLQQPEWPPGGRVIATRSSSPSMGDNKGHFGAGARRMLVDFAGGDLDGLEAAQAVKAQVSGDNVQIDAVTVQRLPNGVWRAVFVATPKVKRPIDLHCYLTLFGEVLTETWVYQWSP